MWQESTTQGRAFTRPSTAFETVSNEKIPGIELIEVNADSSMIATKDAARPKAVWIWRNLSTELQTVLTFRENVRQILWHPSLANVLVVITSQKDPIVYLWHDLTQAPSIGFIPTAAASQGARRFEGTWLPNEVSGRFLFLMSSLEAFDVGFLDAKADEVFFDSILRVDILGDESPDAVNDDCLESTRYERKVNIEALQSLSTDKDDPIYSCAKGTKW